MIQRSTHTLLRKTIQRNYLSGVYGTVYAKRFQAQFRHAYTFAFMEPEQRRTTQTHHDGVEMDHAHSVFSKAKSGFRMNYFPGKILIYEEILII